MRILLLSDAHEMYLGASYCRAFQALGHEVCVIDPNADLGKDPLWRMRLLRGLFGRWIVARFNHRMLPRLIEQPSDFIWVGKGAWAVPWLWKELKRHRPSTKLVCYNADNPIVTYSRGGNRPWVTDSIPCYDLYCTYSRRLVEPLRKAGAAHVLRLPFAWDPQVHPAGETTCQGGRFENDVVFVGNGDTYREEWLGRIFEAGEARGWRTAVFGSWPRCRNPRVRAALRGDGLLGKDMARTIRASALALNILRLQNEGAHNMRTFEVPGCGGVLVSQRSPEQEEFFPEGEAAAYFDDANEAAGRITALLCEPALIESLRRRAGELVARHTYEKRAWTLTQAVRDLSQRQA